MNSGNASRTQSPISNIQHIEERTTNSPTMRNAFLESTNINNNLGLAISTFFGIKINFSTKRDAFSFVATKFKENSSLVISDLETLMLINEVPEDIQSTIVKIYESVNKNKEINDPSLIQNSNSKKFTFNINFHDYFYFVNSSNKTINVYFDSKDRFYVEVMKPN